MFNAVLVDDEILVLNLLEKVIGQREDINIIKKYTDPEKALAEIPELKSDLVFLDIDMPGLNGIELGTKLLETVDNKKMEIVFVTAYDQYAIHAFKINAIHYILKPVDSNSIDEVMERIYDKRKITKPKNDGNAEIKVFGNMQLNLNGKKVDILTSKIEELLALLIINRENGVSKWSIIDALWEEASMEKSQQNLYTMIFRLKKKLRDAGIDIELKYKNSIYTLDLKDTYCDLKEFDCFIKKGLNICKENIKEFEKMIYMYRGDLLMENDYPWCVFDREKYYQHFLNIAISLAAYYTKNSEKNLLERLYLYAKTILVETDYERLKFK